MASSREYLDYVLERLAMHCVTCRSMMGEYLLYCEGRLVGGIYDDRLLVKDIPAARRLLPEAPEELPYEGAKPMLLVECVDDGEVLRTLFTQMAAELPATKPKRRR